MRTCFLVAVLVAGGCGDDPPCDPTTEACTYSAAVSTITVPSGVEDEDTCQSWTLNNPTELWVNSITQNNDGAYHHANWFFVPDHNYKLPDGAWPCEANRFAELEAGLQGGYLFALSTQSLEETQTLPQGAAVRIPPWSRVIGSSHLLNVTDFDITTTMDITIRTIPPPQVTAKLAPARIQYKDLHLDPGKKSSFTTECKLMEANANLWNEPLEYKLYFTLTHYHELGMYQQLEVLGGPRDGEVIMRHEGHGDNAGTALDPPFDLVAAGAQGVRLTCGFNNPRAVPVGWGIGDQEMCVMALQATTQIGWVGDVTGGDTVAGVAPNGEVQHRGPCQMQAFPWDFEKEGGKGH
ncbi:MAG: hypothetical protein H0T46_15770 [Deltaproteobacteria bacterium]|nr:hypothetical protein [Deltaproteobacteria bacterium]